MSDRLAEQAKNREQFDQMVTFFMVAETKAEMEQVAMLFIMDMTYERSDITSAMKSVEIQKGWR